jgi:cysteine desulfurase
MPSLCNFGRRRRSPSFIPSAGLPPTPQAQQQPKESPIYLDNNATTPIDPRVLEAMMPSLSGHLFGNPSAKSYEQGWNAKLACDNARKQVADLIGAVPSEIVFTSGATESDGLAILGVLDRIDTGKEEGAHVVTSLLEHSAILEACKYAETNSNMNVSVTYLSVDESDEGVTTAAAVEAVLRPNTCLVSIMLVNNEIGVINEIAQIGSLCASRGILFHVDACQGLGKVHFDVNEFHVDLMSASSHKLYGPKGVGAIFIHEPIKRFVSPLLRGGGQEGGLRGGTHNVAGIIGFGKACELANLEMRSESQRLLVMRDGLLKSLKSKIKGPLVVNGSIQRGKRVSGNLNVSFPGVDGEALLLRVNQRVAVSSGSACTAASGSISHVMASLGVHEAHARATLRFGLGRFTTPEEVKAAAAVVIDAVNDLQGTGEKVDPSDAITKVATVESDAPVVLPSRKTKVNFDVGASEGGAATKGRAADMKKRKSVVDVLLAGTGASTETLDQAGVDHTLELQAQHGGAQGERTLHQLSGAVEPVRKSFVTKTTTAGASALDHVGEAQGGATKNGWAPLVGGGPSGFEVVARVVNEYDTPVYIDWRTVVSRIRIDPEWVEGLDKSDGYSHLVVVWLMDKVKQKKKAHVPQGLYNTVPKVGIFSCRCPQRPNPIAMTLCKLVRVEGGETLVVEGLDAINNSPILDIKPYTPDFDDINVVRPGETVESPEWVCRLKY